MQRFYEDGLQKLFSEFAPCILRAGQNLMNGILDNISFGAYGFICHTQALSFLKRMLFHRNFVYHARLFPICNARVAER